MKDVALDPIGPTGSESIGAASITSCLSAGRVPMRPSAIFPFSYIVLLDVREFGCGRAAKSRRTLAQFDHDGGFGPYEESLIPRD